MQVAYRNTGLGGERLGRLAEVTMTSLQDIEAVLYEAIVAGDVSLVRRLVGSGLGPNAVLHSPHLCEAISVLGAAAAKGNLVLVKLLVAAGASVNMQDPRLGRSALHWACIGCKQDDVVSFLVGCGADVDALDRDNMSPLMLAAAHCHHTPLKLLVESGASVLFIDRLRCSALHYAAGIGDPRSIRCLILGGCINNNTIFGRGSPLTSLALMRDVSNIRLLLSAGCRVSHQEWKAVTNRLPKNLLDDSLANFSCSNPPSLKQQSRVVVRASMKGQHVQKKIAQLPLPSCLIKYLQLELEAEVRNSEQLIDLRIFD